MQANKSLRFQSHNPATQEIVWEGESSTEYDVDLAVTKATEAFPKWAALPINKRIDYLHAFQQVLMDSQQEFVEAISKETGKPLWDSLGEFKAMVNKIDISIDAYHKRCPEITQTHPLGQSITRHKPHGVVAVFGPFNFPGHLPNGHIVPALLAGNCVVFKPSELTPLVGELMLGYWKKANLPDGVINLLLGGKETGHSLASHPRLNGLFFTGSWETGKLLLEQYASHPEKILALELGGNNPLVVQDVSDIEAAVYTTIQSAFLTSGQRCTCARRLILIEGEWGDEFLQTLIKVIKKLVIGPYTQQPEPFMGPLISEQAALKLIEAQKMLQVKNGQILMEMCHLKKGSGFLSPGLVDVTKIVDRSDQEYFGPLLQVIRVFDFDAAIREANKTAFGLVAGLLSDHEKDYQQFYQQVNAGIINWNSPTTGASSSAPFGGIGHSGNLRPSAYYAADYCSYPVASIVSPKVTIPNSKPPGFP